MSYYSSCSVYSEEDDSSCITSSSSLEVTPSNSSVFQYSPTDPLKSELVVDEEDHCCCVSTEELSANIIDQPLVGWEKRSPCPKSPCPRQKSPRQKSSIRRRLSAQSSEKSILSSCVVVENCNQTCRANSSNDKLSSLSRAIINLGSESKSSLRSYIHSTPAIPYTFHHHLDGDTAVYIEEYRNSYTYPNMEQKHRRMSLNSASKAAMVKPTLFVLDNDCTVRVPLKRPVCNTYCALLRLIYFPPYSVACRTALVS